MRRYLLVALWPAAEAAIAAATVKAARKAPGASGPAAAASGALRAAAGTSGAGAPGMLRAAAGASGAGPGWLPGLARLAAIGCAGGAVSYGVMSLLGHKVVRHGPVIDEPMERWTAKNQVPKWAAVMERLGKVGNTWTTWGAAGTAAACLGVAWSQRKWLPPAVLGSAIVVDHYATLALRHKFARPGPPSSPLGTYPSGGCDRVVLVYGLIAHMLWREFSGTQRGKACAVGAVAALSFNEAYSRQYLGKHWFTDIMSGLIYGGVLLAPFVAAIRLIAGPAGAAGGRTPPGRG